MTQIKIGVLPVRNKTKYTTETYLPVTFKQMEIVDIGENTYMSVVADNVGNALTDTSKWVCIADQDSINERLSQINAIEFDDEPTEGSVKAVKSGSLKRILDGMHVLKTEEEIEVMIQENTWQQDVIYYTEEEE